MDKTLNPVRDASFSFFQLAPESFLRHPRGMILDFFSCCGTVASVMATQNDIMLNGAPYELAEPCSVSRLLELLNMKGKPVVVEHNGAALLPQDFSRVTVSPGDRVEIVSIVAGG
ncbi:thiamine biosynthesis protein ThiS [Akkermansia muciniphila]|jgi:sulfur carrier protein|nr:thiamine biosynthesis protein ThiS [Akkermansia muciniphila]PNC89824.1 thiamine biosynthesis protein ThiS [Akkermansia muciniphila]PND11916.1 thiamine biosynthesis protein ThiS [Akkermansia muciniphila]